MENIFLFFGVRSYEHDISIVTASQIFSRSKLDGFKLVPVYVSKENKFYAYNVKKFDLKDFSKGFSVKNKNFEEIFFVSGENGVVFFKSLFGLKEYVRGELALVVCHGGFGENGKLVSFLEGFKIYTQCGSDLAMALAMDKFLFKQTMKGLKISSVRGFKILKNEQDKDSKRIDFNLNVVGFPVVIKPNFGGSSIGLFVARNREEFDQKIKEAFEFDDEVLVEKFVKGAREFNVAVVGNKFKFVVSEIDEPLKKDEVLSFADKYLSGDQKTQKLSGDKFSMASQNRNLPAKIDADLTKKIKNYAGQIFQKLGFSGVVRIDFLFDEENQKLYVCEVNSIPGSLAFYFFNSGAFLLDEFVLNLIEIARKKRDTVDVFNMDFLTEILQC